MKRYQLSFGLFLVSSLGFAEPGIFPLGGGGLGQGLNPADQARQQQNQALQANLIGQEAKRKAEEQVLALRAKQTEIENNIVKLKAENQKKEKTRLAALQNVEGGVLTRRENEIFKTTNEKNENQAAENEAIIAFQSKLYQTVVKNEQGKFLPSTSPEAVIALRERLETEVGALTDSLENKAIEVGRLKPANEGDKETKPIAQEFTERFLVAALGKPPAENLPESEKQIKLREVSETIKNFVVQKKSATEGMEEKRNTDPPPSAENHTTKKLQTLDDESGQSEG